MKIAFTSCFDVLDDNEQNVWTEIANKQPDVLLLLGDSIYMDFGLPLFSSHPLGKPRRWDAQKFADEMYRRYEAQSQVISFRNLLNSVSNIGAIWDDHDFAWNGSSGLGGKNSRHVVPHDKKLVSKALHMQFREWLRTKPLLQDYPPQPAMDELFATADVGIEESFDIGKVRFLMLDGRYYREEQLMPSDPTEIFEGIDDDDVVLTNMLGEQQQVWLTGNINSWDGINIICSGSTLTGHSDAWEQYLDLAWLKDQSFTNTIVLSGDIHKIASQKHKDLGNLWEFTASGAARPKLGGDSGNYGIINVSDEEVEAELYDEDGLDKVKRVVFE